jgi:hypothetical protein
MPRTLGRLATLSSAREARVGMPRTLGHIARLDRRWFRAHPERRHRCRWPDTVELDLFDCDRGARLVIAIRHLGRGYIVYQPVFFQGGLPRDERSAAALFALAATSSEPIPVIALMDVLRLRRGWASTRSAKRFPAMSQASVSTAGAPDAHPKPDPASHLKPDPTPDPAATPAPPTPEPV